MLQMAQLACASWLPVVICVSMACTNSERSYSCFQPQSRLAALSSKAIGQLSAERGQKIFAVVINDDKAPSLHMNPQKSHL